MNNNKLWNIPIRGLKNFFPRQAFFKNSLLYRGVYFKNFSEVIDANSNESNRFNIKITDNCAKVKNILIKNRK